MNNEDSIHRSHLPIPDPPRTGLITYDAKDPDTKYHLLHSCAAEGRAERADHSHR
jgi:hypothetical protein